MLFARRGAYFSCLLLELTYRDAEQLQVLLMGHHFPEGLDLGYALMGQDVGLLEVMLQKCGGRQLYRSSIDQHEATAAAVLQ